MKPFGGLWNGTFLGFNTGNFSLRVLMVFQELIIWIALGSVSSISLSLVLQHQAIPLLFVLIGYQMLKLCGCPLALVWGDTDISPLWSFLYSQNTSHKLGTFSQTCWTVATSVVLQAFCCYINLPMLSFALHGPWFHYHYASFISTSGQVRYKAFPWPAFWTARILDTHWTFFFPPQERSYIWADCCRDWALCARGKSS